MKDFPELPVLDPKEALQILSASDITRAQKLLISALITQSRSFEYALTGNQSPLLVLDVTHFLNHRINTRLIEAIGEELALKIVNLQPDVILTAPSSGNIPAIAVAQHLPEMPDIIYAPKGVPITMTDTYRTQSRSYTHGGSVPLVVARDCLPKGARVLICDDFLDTGKTATDLLEIIKAAEAIPVGSAFVIEKPFAGRETMRAAGFPDEDIYSLVTIESMRPGRIKILEFNYWFSLVRQ